MTNPVGNPSPGNWVMAFADEFTGTTWSTATWAPNWYAGLMWRTSADGGMVAWSPYDGRGMTVSGSVLSLNAASVGAWPAMLSVDPKCPDPLPSGSQATYSMGLLSSHPSFRFSQGYLEVYASIAYPAVAGDWPGAFLKCASGSWPEIDTIQWNTSGTLGEQLLGYLDNTNTWHNFAETISDGSYHAYGLQVNASDITFYLDGTQVYQVASDGALPPFHVLLEHFVYSAATGTGFPCSIGIDYVRAWVESGTPAQPAITSVSLPNGVPTAGSATVSFGAVSGATSYRVSAFYSQFTADSGGSFTADPDPSVNPPQATGTSSPITVTGLSDNYHYAFTVSALNGTGYSIESLPVPAWPVTQAIAHVQDVYTGAVSNTSSVTVTITTTGGDLLTASIEAYDASPISILSITDSAGDGNWVYSTQSNSQSPPAAYGSSSFAAIAYCPDARAVSQVVVTFNEVVSTAFVTVSEFANVPQGITIDAAASSSTPGSGTSQSTPAITTSGSNDIIIAQTAENSHAWTSASTFYTLVTSSDTAWGLIYFPGSQQVTFSGGASQAYYASAVMALAAPGQVPGGPAYTACMSSM